MRQQLTASDWVTPRRVTCGPQQPRTLRRLREKLDRLFDLRCRTTTAVVKLTALRACLRRFGRLCEMLKKPLSPGREIRGTVGDTLPSLQYAGDVPSRGVGSAGNDAMNCASALSTVRNSQAAIEEVVQAVTTALDGNQADLAVFFASVHHADRLSELSQRLRERRLARHVLGCTGEAIIGEDREVEGQAALSLWVLHAPGIVVKPLRLEFDAEDGTTGVIPRSPGTIVMLGDPFSFPADAWLKLLHDESPGMRVVGGMASGAPVPGRVGLVLDDVVYAHGAVAVQIEGAVSIRTVVSQGCRPIGRPMLITKAEKNLIKELGRRPTLELLRELFESLSPDDQARVRQGLHVGRVINEYQESFGRGDFLVRNVIGADESGAIALTDQVRVGQTVQFHIRDAEAADEDLRTLLADSTGPSPQGALLFSCNGRGTRLFPGSNHDVGVLHDRFGPIPTAGLFAMGEFGPIGGQNFIHGFTASVVLFSDSEATSTAQG